MFMFKDKKHTQHNMKTLTIIHDIENAVHGEKVRMMNGI
jgi:hypothetical protein